MAIAPTSSLPCHATNKTLSSVFPSSPKPLRDADFRPRRMPQDGIGMKYVTSMCLPIQSFRPAFSMEFICGKTHSQLGGVYVRRPLLFILSLLFLSVLSCNLNAQVAQRAPALGIPQTPPLVGDTRALALEAQNWLVDLLKINTTNPPGNEQAAAKYIAGVLAKEGITADILDLAPGRSAVVARLRSSAVADPSKALLLVAHMDVVGVDRSKWSVDPFGGVIKDGYLLGRGSLDDKSMLAANLAAFIALKRGNVHINRDVIFLGRPTRSSSATPA